MNSEISRTSKYRKILLTFLILIISIFIISIFFFVQGILKVHHKWPLHPRNPIGIIFSWSISSSNFTGSLDEEDIESWMTFSYINFRFHLPPKLIQDKLSIHDSKYPNISIKAYAKRNNLGENDLLKELKSIIHPPVINNPL